MALKWCLWKSFINYIAFIIHSRVRTSRFYPPGQPAVDSTYRTHFLSHQGQPSIRVPFGTSSGSRNNNPHPHNMEQVFGHPSKVRRKINKLSDQNITFSLKCINVNVGINVMRREILIQYCRQILLTWTLQFCGE